MQHRFKIKLTALTALLAAVGHVQADDVPALQEVVIIAGRLTAVADSASAGSVGVQQLATRPLLRAAELVEAVPGMIVTQHSGDGKANQYFLRGFNLDHGSDFATFVDGVPVNIASHAHGQGYMDLNFVIPELVSNVQYRKGVYAADDGDFSTTGSARMEYARRVEHPFVEIGAGAHGARRALAAGSGAFKSGQLLAALEVASNDGPWDQPERLRKTSGVLRWSRGSALNGLTLTGQAYRSHWIATEHVPERAIESGEIGRYGALSANDGGVTHRHSVGAQFASTGHNGAIRGNAYAIDYGLRLFSAPSGFISGADGDQHEQADERRIYGGAVQHVWPLGTGELALGLQVRHDRIGRLGLYQTINRERIATVREDSAKETEAGVYGAWQQQWQPWLRTSLGLRHDRIQASTRATGGALNAINGGDVSAGQTSPKVSVIVKPAASAELFFNWGYGFHSNDVRGATSIVNPADGSPAQRLDLFARARGAEVGLRIEPVSGWIGSAALWRMALASELVFVGDEGATAARGASRRHGVEWTNHVSPREGVIIDTSLALARARFDAGGHVPNAIPVTASASVSVDKGGPWFGGLHTRYIGRYALEESGLHKSRPVLTSNLRIGRRITTHWQLGLDILNLFNRHGNDIEYWGGACTAREQASGACGDGIDGRLIHPLEPRTVRASVRAAF